MLYFYRLHAASSRCLAQAEEGTIFELWVQGSHLGSKDKGHLKRIPLSAEGHCEKLELA